MFFGVVDVRDVAKAHLLALENPNTNGNRYIVFDKTMWLEDVAQILRNEFKPLGYNVTSKTVGKCPIWLMSFVSSKAKGILKSIGISYKLENSKSVNELGMKYISAEKSIVDMGYCLIEMGNVPDKRKSINKA